MSANLFKKVDSSDYITYKKRTVMANTAPTNPVKTNGKQYNRNFTFVPTLTDASANCLLQAHSQELKQDYTSGLTYINGVCP